MQTAIKGASTRRRASGAGSPAALLLACLALLPTARTGVAQDLPPAGTVFLAEDVPVTGRMLHLEVFVNAYPTRIIAEFREEDDGGLSIEPGELERIGLKADGGALLPDGRVAVGRLPGLAYQYSEASQTISFTVEFDRFSSRVIEAHRADPLPAPSQKNLGGLLNYTLYASTGTGGREDPWEFQGASGWLEGRVFGPLGVISHAQIVSTSGLDHYDTVRLDTTWSYSDPGTMVTYQAGDVISGGLAWTRPTRLGGFRVHRNFRLRPDLITMPLPALAGSAAVPSTVEVFIDNTRRLQQQVPPGPFVITSLPVITGAGDARIVVRDALGRETVSHSSFFASSDLLAPGLWDFSAEAGFARRFYGTQSHSYDNRFMGSATARYGLTDRLTIEGHAEGGGGLWNAGAGAVFGLGHWGVGSLSGAASSYDGHMGYQLHGSVELQLGEFRIYGRTQRTFGDYLDIAAVTAEGAEPLAPLTFLDSRPARAIDQVSLSLPLSFDPAAVNLSFTSLETVAGDRSQIASLSLTRPLGRRASLFATAYKDFSDRDSAGLYAGLSLSFDGGYHAATGVSSGAHGTSVTADLMKSGGDRIGSYGWRLRDSEGAQVNRHASAQYRASFGRMEAGIGQVRDSVQAHAQLEGAVIFADGDVFLANRVHDAFAVVDAGAPGVEVKHENRPIGKTNRNGKLLVPDLRSYERNRISIDPANLPVDAVVERTAGEAVPADRSGTVVRFGVDAAPDAALIALRTEAGEPVEAGSIGTLSGAEEEFVVGYDGLAYVTGLASDNEVRIDEAGGGTCVARFSYRRQQGSQVTIDGVICRRVE